MEKEKERLKFQYYSIKQASVEQIFNQFAEEANEFAWLYDYYIIYI